MSQLIKKFIGDDQVGAAKIRLENNSYLTARNSSDTGDVNIVKVNASQEIEIGDGGAVNIAGNIVPDVDDSREIGTAALSYNAVWTDAVYSNNADFDISADAVGAEINVITNGEIVNIQSYNGAVAPTLRLFDADTNYVGVKAPTNLTANYTLTLPADDGAADQVLKTDGAGVLSWVNQSSGSTPATQTFVLGAGDITNQYVTLSNTPVAGSVHFMVKGAGVLLEGASYDYSVSGAQVNFLNDIATGGPAALVAGDVVQVKYMY